MISTYSPQCFNDIYILTSVSQRSLHTHLSVSIMSTYSPQCLKDLYILTSVSQRPLHTHLSVSRISKRFWWTDFWSAAMLDIITEIALGSVNQLVNLLLVATDWASTTNSKWLSITSTNWLSITNNWFNTDWSLLVTARSRQTQLLWRSSKLILLKHYFVAKLKKSTSDKIIK